MVKSELITRLAARQENLSLRDVELSVNHILEKMSDSLANGHRIEVRGFGSFSLHYRPPRRAHNPKTGAHVQTVGKYTPHFKPGKDLRERVIASFERGVPIVDSKEEDDSSSGSDTSGSTSGSDHGGLGSSSDNSFNYNYINNTNTSSSDSDSSDSNK